MSINALNEALNALRLSGMKDVLEHQLLHPSFDDQPFTDRLLMLVNAQVERRRENKIKSLTSRAKFKYLAATQDIKFSSDRNMAKAEILEFLKCDWIERGQHVLLTVPSGTGKTWISCALGLAAVRKEKSVKYQRVLNFWKTSNMHASTVHFELCREFSKQLSCLFWMISRYIRFQNKKEQISSKSSKQEVQSNR